MNRAVKFGKIADGTSNTMVIGEILRGLSGEQRDYRGVHWYDHVATSQIHTAFEPNSQKPDFVFSLWCTAALNQPANNLPCRPGSPVPTEVNNNVAGARSRHPGGVHVGMADGSAQFIQEAVELNVWQALGSINWGEVVELP